MHWMLSEDQIFCFCASVSVEEIAELAGSFSSALSFAGERMFYSKSEPPISELTGITFDSQITFSAKHFHVWALAH